MRKLGLTGGIEILNVGSSMTDRISTLVRDNSRLILLTDWDDKGCQLFDRLSELAHSEGMKVDESYWRSLVKLAQKEIQTVEELPSLIGQLQGFAMRSGDRRFRRGAHQKAPEN